MTEAERLLSEWARVAEVLGLGDAPAVPCQSEVPVSVVRLARETLAWAAPRPPSRALPGPADSLGALLRVVLSLGD